MSRQNLRCPEKMKVNNKINWTLSSHVKIVISCPAWISTPGDGLTKRQCSLQVCFRPVGKQLPLAIIFRGKGTRWTKRKLDIQMCMYIFRKMPGVDTSLACQWMEKTIKPCIEEENLARYTLFCDNLTAQTSDQFKETVSDGRGVVWYGLRNATDLWQPVDAGIAYTP